MIQYVILDWISCSELRMCASLPQTQEVKERPSRQPDPLLFESWLEFVYSARLQDGLYGKLPSTRGRKCYCNKGRMSFLHWPPTSIEEATELYGNCFDEDNTHRRYLPYCWWTFINKLATMHKWPSQNNQQRYEQLASHIQAMFPAVSVELERDRRIPVRPVGWRCNEMCVEILEKKDSCTCFCRDEWSVRPCSRERRLEFGRTIHFYFLRIGGEF